MILGTIIFTALGTFMELLDNAAIWIANEILDDTITVFSADQNVFVTFINLIPFSKNVDLGAVIKGVAYGLVALLMVLSIVKSITSPFTGDDAPNPAQAGVRAAVAMVMIIAIFGASYWGKTGIYYGGLLSPVGKWFGTVLSKIGATPNREIKSLLKVTLDTKEYIAGIILEAGMLASIVGAALQYVERLVSFAVYIIFGPIAVAMYAAKETSEICKQWMMGLISEFLSITISLIMWGSFITCANTGDGSLLNFAVLIAILGLMRNSEKIINAMGFKTISLGDSARSVLAGVGALSTLYMVGSTASRFVSSKVTGKTSFGQPGGGTPQTLGTAGAFDGGGNFGHKAAMYVRQAGQILTAGNPAAAIKNAVAQNTAINDVKSAFANGTNISGATLNAAMGFNSNSPVFATGSTFAPATLTGADGKTVNGFVGDATFSRNGKMESVKDAFVPIQSTNNGSFNAGDKISFKDQSLGERYLQGTGAVFNNNGYAGLGHNMSNYVYKTTGNIPIQSGAETSPIYDSTGSVLSNVEVGGNSQINSPLPSRNEDPRGPLVAEEALTSKR